MLSVFFLPVHMLPFKFIKLDILRLDLLRMVKQQSITEACPAVRRLSRSVLSFSECVAWEGLTISLRVIPYHVCGND